MAWGQGKSTGKVMGHGHGQSCSGNKDWPFLQHLTRGFLCSQLICPSFRLSWSNLAVPGLTLSLTRSRSAELGSGRAVHPLTVSSSCRTQCQHCITDRRKENTPESSFPHLFSHRHDANRPALPTSVQLLELQVLWVCVWKSCTSRIRLRIYLDPSHN